MPFWCSRTKDLEEFPVFVTIMIYIILCTVLLVEYWYVKYGMTASLPHLFMNIAISELKGYRRVFYIVLVHICHGNVDNRMQKSHVKTVVYIRCSKRLQLIIVCEMLTSIFYWYEMFTDISSSVLVISFRITIFCIVLVYFHTVLNNQMGHSIIPFCFHFMTNILFLFSPKKCIYWRVGLVSEFLLIFEGTQIMPME